MEKSFELIKVPLSFTGFNIYCDNPKIGHTLRRVLFYTSTTAVLFCAVYCALIDKHTKFSDRIFLNITALAYVSAIVQAILFRKYKEKFVKNTKSLDTLHQTRDEEWLEPFVKPLFDECSGKVFKMTKYDRT